MQCGTPLKCYAAAIAFALSAAIISPAPLLAQSPGIKFTGFNVPGSTGGAVSVLGVNNLGLSVGFYALSSGVFGFLRAPSGGLAPLADPVDTGTPYTAPTGVNNTGTIVGVFFNPAANADNGFLYATGTYQTYVFPGLPPGTGTVLAKTNDVGGLCGYMIPAATPTETQAFISLRNGAETTTFSVKNSRTQCLDINDVNTTAGSYQDSAGVWHGFVRTAGGTITTIDVPGASTTPGSVPCPIQSDVGSTAAGTIVEGINNLGDVSGHFWDKSHNEHGFVLSPTSFFAPGKFTQIDFPGAFQTAGSKLNDLGEIVGHYTDKSCNGFGYTAQLPPESLL